MTLDWEQIAKDLNESVIGRPLKEVQAEATRTGWTVRVAEQDGKSCIGTCEYNPSRFSVVVKNGIVVELCGIG